MSLVIETVYRTDNIIFIEIEHARQYIFNIYKQIYQTDIKQFENIANKKNIETVYRVYDVIFENRKNASVYLAKELLKQQYKIRHGIDY